MAAGSSSKTRNPPPPALQKSLSRRVSFNEATLTNNAKSAYNGRPVRPPPSVESVDSESQIQASPRRTRRGCTSCCAWTSIIIAVLLIVAVLLGGIYFAFLQSNLPEVRLHRLDVNKIVVEGGDAAIVTADLEAYLNATNDNGRVELRYGRLIATVSSAGVDFGAVRLADMDQQPHATAEIKVHAMANKLPVEVAAGKELLDNAGKRLLVVDVVVKGYIDFIFGGKRITTMPFKIDCHSIDQTEIDDGHAPKCNTKLSPLG